MPAIRTMAWVRSNVNVHYVITGSALRVERPEPGRDQVGTIERAGANYSAYVPDLPRLCGDRSVTLARSERGNRAVRKCVCPSWLTIMETAVLLSTALFL